MRHVLAIFAVFGVLACRPPVDDCFPDETRCSTSGVPQRCVGTTKGENTRWTNYDRPCSELRDQGGTPAVCCLSRSRWAGRVVRACVPQAACMTDVDASVSTDSSVQE